MSLLKEVAEVNKYNFIEQARMFKVRDGVVQDKCLKYTILHDLLLVESGNYQKIDKAYFMLQKVKCLANLVHRVEK